MTTAHQLRVARTLGCRRFFFRPPNPRKWAATHWG